MADTYGYVSVKLYLKPGADIQEVVQECDYHFAHDDIIETEVVSVLDTQGEFLKEWELFMDEDGEVTPAPATTKE